MARSAEAIQARAQKRNRSVAEQRRADSLQQQQQQKLQPPNPMMPYKSHSHDTTTTLPPPITNKHLNDKTLSPIMINHHHDDHHRDVANDDHDAADANNTPASNASEPGAWTCPKCENFNFASRRTCHSKTCDETRPAAATAAYYNNNSSSRAASDHQRRQPPFGKPRHDPATSKVVPWTAPPATKEQLERNRELRQRYLDATAASGETTEVATTNKKTIMTLEEIQRAQILVARDERKEQRRQEKRDRRQRWRDVTVKSDPAFSTATATTTSIPAAKDKSRAQKLAEELRRERRRLRKLYLSTNGVGMKEDDIQRAKALVARHEKKQRRTGKLQRATAQAMNVKTTTTFANEESN